MCIIEKELLFLYLYNGTCTIIQGSSLVKDLKIVVLVIKT